MCARSASSLARLAEVAMFVLLGVALAQVPLQGALLDGAVLTLVLVLVIRPGIAYPAAAGVPVLARGGACSRAQVG